MNQTIEKIKEFYSVSEEQKERLETYASLLKKWNNSINLIGKSTEEDIYDRHILDSAQLLKYTPKDAVTIADFGSGAGLPGLIIAILNDKYDVHLIESNTKKCAFLTEVTRQTGTRVTIHNKRVEDIKTLRSDVITARAFAEIEKIFELADDFIKKDSAFILLRGKNVEQEIANAQKYWAFSNTLYQSILSEYSTDNKAGYVTVIKGVKKISNG